MYYDDDIESIEASDVSEAYMCLYGTNVNLQRSIPMINDGIKLVVRRLLYMMYLKYRNSSVKGVFLYPFSPQDCLVTLK